MELNRNITSKKKRSITRDIDSIFSSKNWIIPKTIADLKELGLFAPE